MWFYFEYDTQSASVDDSFSLGARYRQDRDKIRTRYRQDTDKIGTRYGHIRNLVQQNEGKLFCGFGLFELY